MAKNTHLVVQPGTNDQPLEGLTSGGANKPAGRRRLSVLGDRKATVTDPGGRRNRTSRPPSKGGYRR